MSRSLRTARIHALALLTLSGLAACADPEAGADSLAQVEQPIFYGTRTPSITNLTAGEEMAIGFIADSSGTPFCTATLIDRDVAVTARHCVEDTYAIDEMYFGMGDPNDPSALVQVHSAPYHDELDVALLMLRQDAVSQVGDENVEPLSFLRETPQQAWIGSSVEASGYGQTHDDSTGKYYVEVELEDIQDDFIVVNGRGQRGICFGDSGGPLFVHVGNGEPVIAGVESHGDSSCVDQDFETRLDRSATWIDQQMEAFDPSSPPQTGTQGDSCDAPLGGLGESKCGLGGFPCSSAPIGQMTPTLIAVGLLVLGALLRRRTVAAEAETR